MMDTGTFGKIIVHGTLSAYEHSCVHKGKVITRGWKNRERKRLILVIVRMILRTTPLAQL